MSPSESSVDAFADQKVTEDTSPAIGAFAAGVVIISGLNDLVGRWGLGAIATLACVIWCWSPLRTRLRELRRLWSRAARIVFD